MESTFDQVIGFLNETFEVRILVDWDALSEEGVEGDVWVELPRRLLRLREFLELILADASEEDDLTYDVQDGLLVVSTQAKLWRRMTLRIYDVRNLLAEARRWHSATPDAMLKAHANCLCCPTRACVEAGLAGVIRQSVAPHSWRANAGGPATIEFFNGMMVVRQNKSPTGRSSGSWQCSIGPVGSADIGWAHGGFRCSISCELRFGRIVTLPAGRARLLRACSGCRIRFVCQVPARGPAA